MGNINFCVGREPLANSGISADSGIRELPEAVDAQRIFDSSYIVSFDGRQPRRLENRRRAADETFWVCEEIGVEYRLAMGEHDIRRGRQHGEAGV